MGKLAQLTLDNRPLPMPFDQIPCADLVGWTEEVDAPGWRKVAASIGDLIGPSDPAGALAMEPPPLPTKPSIVVLPFTRLSADADQSRLRDCLADERVDPHRLR